MGYHLTNDVLMDLEFIGSGSGEMNYSGAGYNIYTAENNHTFGTMSSTSNATADEKGLADVARTIFEVLFMSTIILAAIIGNLLVILSVYKFPKLQITANSFIVSLAFADLLVALLVMPFNASQIITG